MHRVVNKKLLFPYKVFPIPKKVNVNKETNTSILCTHNKLNCPIICKRQPCISIVKSELLKIQLER